MSRIEYTNKVIEGEFQGAFYWEQRITLASALIHSLDPQETCEILDPSFSQESAIRRAILRKISSDMKNEFHQCHHDLIKDLIQAIDEVPYVKKSSGGYCLSTLYDYLPPALQRAVIEYFLESKYVRMRRRAYKQLRVQWDPHYLSQVSETWIEYKDFNCALLITEKFPITYLEEHLQDLERVLIQKSPRYLTQLFLRLGAADKKKLEHLASLNEITFTYVCAKLQIPLDIERALAIFERYKFDERVGLLIWCFGQMGLWSVIVQIINQLEKLNQEQLAHRHKKYGFHKPVESN